MNAALLAVSVTAILTGLAVAGSQREADATFTAVDEPPAAKVQPAAPGAALALSKVQNRQINDPALDTIQMLPGTRPFLHASSSDASLAVYGQNLVAVYGTSGARIAPQLTFERRLQVGYAYSSDGGRSWKSGYLPALSAGLPWTGGVGPGSFGYGVVDVDRRGVFHTASLQFADGLWTIAASRSVDGGRTFSPAKPIDAPASNLQNARIAIGPDPARPGQDNVYLVWGDFVFSPTGLSSVLRLARSRDGGESFEVKTIFAPPPATDQNHPQNQIDHSMPVVDKTTGKLYIALMNYGFVNDDYIRILASEDGGDTFSLLDFDRPGAPDAQALPVVQPGTFAECGGTPAGGAAQLVLHTGADVGGSVSGLPRYVRSSRVVTQPVLAVSKGAIHLAWSASNKPVFGDPASGANILYMRSLDDGRTWSEPAIVSTHATPSQRSVVPAIAIGRFQIETALPFLPSPKDVHLSYYTQRPDGAMVLNLAGSKNRGASFPASLRRELSDTAFELPPTNVPLPTAANPFQTTHFNRTRFRCLALGDITGLTVGNGRLHAAWTDTRNTIAHPVDALDPLSGQSHPKEDVFYASPSIR